MKITGVKFLKIWKIEGIVLYPFILFAEKQPDIVIGNHERIHWDQIRRDGVIKFYGRYLKEYFQGRWRGLSHDAAYRSISYEEEAYAHQADLHYQVGPDALNKLT